MRWLWLALLLGGCMSLGPSPEMLKALAGDGACVAFASSLNTVMYGGAGGGIARLNRPGAVMVERDGTLKCRVDPTAGDIQ